MNKRIILTSFLSIVAAVAVTAVMDWFFPRPTYLPLSEASSQTQQLSQKSSTEQKISQEEVVFSTPQKSLKEKEIAFETEKYKGSFSTRGAILSSLKFKDYKDEKKQDIELVDSISKENLKGLFKETLRLNDTIFPQDLIFELISHKDNSYLFQTSFQLEGVKYSLCQSYRLPSKEYLLEVSFWLEDSSKKIIPINSEIAFLNFLPAYGLNDPTSFHFYNEKLFSIKKPKFIEKALWAGATNRYLALAFIPTQKSPFKWNLFEKKDFVTTFSPVKNELGKNTFYVYIGPKDKSYLSIYGEEGSNHFGLFSLYLESLIQKGWLSSLETLLSFVLGFFYKVIPNWGVAIILLTIMVKVLLYPAVLKAHLSTASLQKVQPEMKRLQDLHKDDPKKMQLELQKLYQKHGVNPLGGCLPILVQIPIFFALYALLNNYLPLRGAYFIHHWIEDLSLPESIYHFSSPLPFLGWNDIHLLPFIMLGTQFLSGWVSMNMVQSGAVSNGQQKFLFYGMPTLFFFVLYNMASGLLIYWIVNNLLTVLQQTYLTRYQR